MRVKVTLGGIRVQAIAGTHVVVLGFDATPLAADGLLGFAVERTDHTEDEKYFLAGYKTFRATFPDPPAGALVSTRDHPIQDFVWSDYSAKPGHSYTYRVVPLYGKPKNIVEGPSVSAFVETEREDLGRHAVFFNRGVIGSQAYARKFGNKSPETVGQAAWTWLSRGLFEAMTRFIAQADGPGFSIRGSVYEFTQKDVLKALMAAADTGADVQILYDSKGSTGAADDEAIDALGLRPIVIKRTTQKTISHNKFLVLSKDGKPVEVWTGSTNLSQNGIFGHANVGHLVRDEGVAAAYLAYWERLAANPKHEDLQKANLKATPDLVALPKKGSVVPIFSPRPSIAMLAWYATRMDMARKGAFFTPVFGIHKLFADVLGKDDKNLRYVILEKGDDAGTMELVRRDKDTRIAIGAYLKSDALDRWLKERSNPMGKFVLFLHTKFLLVDPLGEDPLVITGSANFSEPSTVSNDENMLVIRGDKSVADLYLGEFMRLFDHFKFRDFVARVTAKPPPPPAAPPPAPAAGAAAAAADDFRYLAPDDGWTKKGWYTAGSPRSKERVLFSGG